MWRRQSSQAGWREAVAPVQQEVTQYGRANLDTLQTSIDFFATAAPTTALETSEVLDAVVLIAQQLVSLRPGSSSSSADEWQPSPSHAADLDEQQQPQQQLIWHTTCSTLCRVIKAILASPSGPQQQQQQQQRSYRRHQQQQQQQQQCNALLPTASVTSLCSCLRQWAYQQPLGPGSSSSNGDTAAAAAIGDQQQQLQQAALDALAVLLPKQLPALAAGERNAVLALLQSLVQIQRSSSSSSSSCGSGSANLLDQAANLDDHSLHLQTTAAHILGQLCKRSSITKLQKDEAANITRALVGAITSSTTIGRSSSGSSSSSHRLVEDADHVKYYTALLNALHCAVYEDKQGWQSYAGQITEAARQLMTYGTHQQQQQQIPSPKQAQQTAAVVSPRQQQQAVAGSPTGSSSSSISASPAAAAAVVGAAPAGRSRYVPPHMRGTAAAAAAAVGPSPSQQQQHDGSSDPDSSATDWSDISDSEQQQQRSRPNSSSSSRPPQLQISDPRSRSRSARDQDLDQQQQQLLLAVDPIRSYRVRVALLQLLQGLVHLDPKGLHPYLSSLLPCQQVLLRQPLSPHLITLLMYDPCNKVRHVCAGVLCSLLEGPAARGLFAVAEARSSSRSKTTSVRCFTTLSVSLGQMLLSLHTGLLAAVATWQQQQQQQQQDRQQQQQSVLDQMPSTLLTAVLRALCCLVQVTPYDRFPPGLLPEVVETMWLLWQQQQQASDDYSSSMTAAVAVLAQALSTKKPNPGVEAWLMNHAPAAAAAAAGSVGSGSSSSSSMIHQLLSAAVSPRPLLRIEALAALRGCCVNYPAIVSAAAVGSDAHVGENSLKGRSSSSSNSSSLKAVLSAVHFNIEETNQVVRTPRGSARLGSPAAAAGSDSSTEVSASTSPEDKAAQHAVNLLGDWLAAAAAITGSSGPSSSSSSSDLDRTVLSGKCPSESIAAAAVGVSAADLVAGSDLRLLDHPRLQDLISIWSVVLDLLLSDQIWQHPNYMIRSAAAGVLGDTPAAVWQQLLPDKQQHILRSLAAAAAHDSITAARAAACKVLGSLVLLPGMLQDQQQQLLLLEPLGSSVKDSAVSVRINASWAVANACDALKQPMHSSKHSGAAAAAAPSGLRQLHPDSTTAAAAGGGGGSPIGSSTAAAAAVAVAADVSPVALRLLCECALTASNDTEKVRANGIRAVGALLAAWQQQWGLLSSSSSSSSDLTLPVITNPGSSSSSSSSSDWSWVSNWLRSAAALLQSCLAARSMKVVWNAAYAAAGVLANNALHTVAVVNACIPSLLLLLFVLVRDSSNYKIKIHAAAAIGAVRDRITYGEVFADAVLVLISALEALDSGSSSSSSDVGLAVAAAGGSGESGVTEDDGSFPNFRYLPALQAQLQHSLLHMLTMLQPTDATRLREPLQRRKQLLLRYLAAADHSAAAAAAAGAIDSRGSSSGRRPGQQRAVSGATVAAVEQQQQQQQQLLNDPFSKGDLDPVYQSAAPRIELGSSTHGSSNSTPWSFQSSKVDRALQGLAKLLDAPELLQIH